MRIAGDALNDDQIIDMMIALEEEYNQSSDSKLSSAYNKLVDAVESFKEADATLIDAGVKLSALQGLKRLDTGELVGGSPGPYLKGKGGLHTRIFMDTAVNPVTGGTELVPARNTFTGKPITLTSGHQPQVYGKQNMANEAVMLTALQLMGDNARMNPANATEAGARQGHADFQRRNGNEVRNVEGMIRQSDGYGANTVAIPSHTAIIPKGRSQNITRDVRDTVRQLMAEEGISGITATEKLVADGTFRNIPMQQRAGKLLRSDPNVFDSPYHELIVTGYPEDTYSAEGFRDDSLLAFPDTVHLAPDLNAVRQFSEQKMTNPRKVVTGKENTGLYGGGPARSKVQQVLNLSDRGSSGRLFEDLTRSHPKVEQLLRHLPYKRKPSR